jgi:hypothetical protein
MRLFFVKPDAKFCATPGSRELDLDKPKFIDPFFQRLSSLFGPKNNFNGMLPLGKPLD